MSGERGVARALPLEVAGCPCTSEKPGRGTRKAVWPPERFPVLKKTTLRPGRLLGFQLSGQEGHWDAALQLVAEEIPNFRRVGDPGRGAATAQGQILLRGEVEDSEKISLEVDLSFVLFRE